MIKILLIFVFSLFVGPSHGSITCDFDLDFCDYEPNEFFVRYTGKSPSVSSGPYYDKTTGDEGFYALCMGKKLFNPNSTCVLSQKLNKTDINQTLEFWYYQFGFQIGTLSLVINSNQTIWESSGRQANEWLYTNVILPSDTFQIEFIGNRSIDGRMSSDVAIDDIVLENQPMPTRFPTTTRRLVKPGPIKGSDFDSPNYLQGWDVAFKNYEWIQTNGSVSSFVGTQGPKSDFTSIMSNVYNIKTKRMTTKTCEIPYVIENNEMKAQYYCQVSFSLKEPICGLATYPQFSTFQDSIGICKKGYYMMITNDKFEKPNGSFRSRFISPVFLLSENQEEFYISFSYNIHGNVTDGFNFIIENYLNPKEYVTLLTLEGPLKEDKWYLASKQLLNLNYEQYRFIFEPFRRASTGYSSISIDSFNILIGSLKDLYQDIESISSHDFAKKDKIELSRQIGSIATSPTSTLKAKIAQKKSKKYLFLVVGLVLLMFVIVFLVTFLQKKGYILVPNRNIDL